MRSSPSGIAMTKAISVPFGDQVGAETPTRSVVTSVFRSLPSTFAVLSWLVLFWVIVMNASFRPVGDHVGEKSDGFVDFRRVRLPPSESITYSRVKTLPSPP